MYLSHFLMEILLFLIMFNLVSCFYIASHLGHSLFLTLFTVCARPPPLFPPQHVSLRRPGAEWLNAVLKGEIGLQRSEGCIPPFYPMAKVPFKGGEQKPVSGSIAYCEGNIFFIPSFHTHEFSESKGSRFGTVDANL